MYWGVLCYRYGPRQVMNMVRELQLHALHRLKIRYYSPTVTHDPLSSVFYCRIQGLYKAVFEFSKNDWCNAGYIYEGGSKRLYSEVRSVQEGSVHTGGTYIYCGFWNHGMWRYATHRYWWGTLGWIGAGGRDETRCFESGVQGEGT